MYNGHQAPEGIFFLQEKESNSRQSVEALAVANGSVIPAKCHQYPPQLVNLGGRDLRDTRNVFEMIPLIGTSHYGLFNWSKANTRHV